MSANPPDKRPELEAVMTPHETAVALVEWLVRHRGWPTGVRYDETVLTVGLGGAPNVFKASVSPLLPEGGAS